MLSSRLNLKERVSVVDTGGDLRARAALMSSGTMSLSIAIAGIPGVIAYRAHPLTYLLGRMLVKVPHLGMANILLPLESPYPEFLQGKANGKLLHQSMVNIFNDNGVEEQSALVAQKLIECLKVSDERGVVEWLSQEISLA
jgi:lipid-A-disaccharide synthase